MPKAAPLLSICIPTYNRVNFLIQCLESITSQIDEEISNVVEIIISDNASTDNTKDVVLASCQKHRYISYFRNSTNLGAERNVFEAVKRAKGEYLWIIGDDDLLLEGALKKILPLLKEGTFDFIMTNKMVKNTDMSETLIENQNPAYNDTTFSDIRDLCCEFGFFTNLGFISTAIFKRQDFMAVDPNPYLAPKMEFPQNGVLLEAFKDRPCLYLSDVLVCQRQFTNVEFPRFGQYVQTIGVIRMFKVLKAKGIIDYTFVERIKENPLGRTHCTIIDEIFFGLEEAAKNTSIMTQSDWVDIMEFFSHFENDEYQKRAFQIYAEYMSRLAVEHITGEARTRFLDRLLEADTGTPEKQQPELYKTGLDMMGQWITSDERVNVLKEFWKKFERIKGKPIYNNESAIEEMLSTLETATKKECIIPQHEWLDIMEALLYYFKNDEYRKRVFQIYSEYISRLAVEHITGEVRTRFLERLLEADTRKPKRRRLEPHSTDVDIMGQWFALDNRVTTLRRIWKYFIERIREKPVYDNESAIADRMLSILETAAKQEYIIPQQDWMDIMEFFLYFKNDEYKKRVFQIYSEYISRLTIERITGEVRTRTIDRLVVADTGAPEKQRFEPETIGVDIMGQWLASDIRVAALKRVWKYSMTLLHLLRRVTTPAMRRMIWRLYQRFRPARTVKS